MTKAIAVIILAGWIIYPPTETSAQSAQTINLSRTVPSLGERQLRAVNAYQERHRADYIYISPDLDLRGSKRVQLPIRGQRPVTFEVTEVVVHPSSDFYLVGEAVGERGRLFLSRAAQAYHGSAALYDRKVRFKIEPLGKGQHLVVPIPPGGPEAEPSPAHAPGETAAPSRPISGKSASLAQIDVLCAYTSLADAHNGNMDGLCNSHIGSANSVLTGSGLGTTATLTMVGGALLATGAEGGASSVNINNLVADGDGSFDEVHAERANRGADIVILLMHDPGAGVRGRAAGWAVGADNAFAIVEADDGEAWNTLIHEVGHLLGGYHDDVTASPSYAKGYKNDALEYTSIMGIAAYYNYERFPYFSDPQGTPTTSDGSQDMVRLWEERAAVLADFSNQLGPLLPANNLTITNAGSINQFPNLAWNASPTPGVTYKLERCAAWYQSCQSTWTTLMTGTGTTFTDTGISISNPAGADDEYRYRVETSRPGDGLAHSNTAVTWGIEPQWKRAPEEDPMASGIGEVYPNPTTSGSMLPITLDAETTVSVEVVDLLGRTVGTVERMVLAAGQHQVPISVGSVATGFYLVRTRLEHGGTTRTIMRTITARR